MKSASLNMDSKAFSNILGRNLATYAKSKKKKIWLVAKRKQNYELQMDLTVFEIV